MAKKFENCPICNSDRIYLFVTTYDRHYGFIERLYDVYRCNSCGLLFLNPMIENQELFQMYSEDDYYAYRNFKINKSIFFKVLSAAKKILISIPPSDLRNYNFRNKAVLDLGCGSGKALFLIRHKGAKEVYGVEISEKATEMGNKLNLNIINGTLENANFEDNKFDYIRSNHSFEHLTNPLETLIEMRRILKPGGELFVGVPNTKSLMFSLFKQYWYYLGVPFHPYNYNSYCFNKFLTENGFIVKRITYCGNSQGILGSLQIFLNRKNKKTSRQGIVSNIFTDIIATQIARIINILKAGDCIEIIAVKR